MITKMFKRMHGMMFIMMLVMTTGYAQVTTIVNYDFNSGTTYNTLTPILASGVTCVADGVSTYSLAPNGATATGPNAFTTNTGAGNGLVMTNSSGTNTRYFEFQLAGADLSKYYAYKIYFQSQRGGAGAAKITVAYSQDGVNYTNFGSTQAPGLGSPAECLYDLSSITSINLLPALYFRILVSGASGTGAMGIDNFQIRATKCTTPANISAGTNKILTCSNPSAVLTGSSTTSGVTYSWSPGGATTSSITVSTAGTYTVKVTDPATGCINTATVSVTTNTIPPILGIAPVPTTSLTGYWPFDSNANDMSGSGNHGTVTGASLTADRFGNPNKAYYFDGVSNKIDVMNSSTIDMVNGNDYSVSFWMKTDPGNGYALPVSKAPLGGGWNGYHFFVNCTDVGYCNGVGKFSFYTASGGGGDACADNLISNDFNNWYFITGQYNGATNQTSLYVNGVLQSDIGSASGTLSNTAPLRFGACACGPYQFYKGALDDIRFYKRLLSKAEINALYNEANPVSVIPCGSPGLTLIGYSPTAGVTYSWSPGGTTTQSLSVTSAGTYTLKVTDPSNGCSQTTSYLIKNEICVDAVISDYQSGSEKGSGDIAISGGTAPYNVAWNGIKFPSLEEAYNILAMTGYPVSGDSVAIMEQYNQIIQRTHFDDLDPGRYPITIYDQAGDSTKVTAVINSEVDTMLARGVVISSSPSHRRVTQNRTVFYGRTMTVQQSGTYVAGKSYVVLANRFKRDIKHVLEFSVPDTTHISFVGLRDTAFAVNGNAADIKRISCFEFNGSTYNVWINDTLKKSGKYNPGDVFAISNANNRMLFGKNEEPVYSYPLGRVPGGDDFMPKVILGSIGTKIEKILVLGPVIKLRDNIIGTVTDVTCGNACGGSIDAYGIPILVSQPVQYELYYGNNTVPIATINSFPSGDHALFAGLCAGTYTVKYCYTQGKAYDYHDPMPMRRSACITQTFEIAYMPDWVNVTSNVSVGADKTLTKTSGLAFDWDAGASSLNFLESSDDGWIEWNSSTIESLNAIGFSTVDTDPTINTINYGVGYMNMTIIGLWKYYVKTHNETMINSVLGNGNPLTAYTGNVKFRLQKTGTTISLYANNLPISSFTGVSPQAFLVDASLKKLSGTIVHPRISFGCRGLEQYTTLKKKLDGGYYTAYNKKLLFKYDEEYADTDGLLKFNIYDKNNNIVMNNTSLSGPSPLVRYGDNRYVIDIANPASIVAGQSMPASNFYILEVINEKNEKWYLRFKK